MLAFLLFLAAAPLAAADIFVDDPGTQIRLWRDFKSRYGRVYEASEDAARFMSFLENLKLADERNAAERAAGGSAVHGVTRFSDLSPAEFRARYTTSRPSKKKSRAAGVEEVDDVLLPHMSVDWTGKYTTPVKDQGSCGSCWAFSAVEQIESDVMRTLGEAYVLSPQQVVSCDSSSFGCSGGWTEHAYDYVMQAGGLEQDRDLNYTSYAGSTGLCGAEEAKFVVSLDGYETISGERAMARFVATTGPLSVCVDASHWSTYTGGVMHSCGKSVDHCVQAVGISLRDGSWLVRNSWGTEWGEEGHIRLNFGEDVCAITNDPTHVIVSATTE